jgi:putative peptidoglycan lipid II flippase
VIDLAHGGTRSEFISRLAYSRDMWSKANRGSTVDAYPGAEDKDSSDSGQVITRAEDDHEPTEPVMFGRFRLVDHINGDANSGLWLAQDDLLKRTVSLRLISASDPQQEEMRAAAVVAAHVVDRRVAQVIDVLDVDGTVVVVSEWVEGIPLEQLLTTPMSTGRAIHITSEIAAAVEQIHAAGTTHGRIRPASVMITEEGEVRLRGHVLDAKKWEVTPGFDPVNADISSIGAILMACLTGYWLGTTGSQLPPAPILGGQQTVPSQLRVGTTSDLDDFVIRSMAATPSAETINSSRPFTTASAAATALTGLDEGASLVPFRENTGGPIDFDGAQPAPTASGATVLKRAAAISLIAIAAISCLLIGARLLIPNEADKPATGNQRSLEERSAGSAGITSEGDDVEGLTPTQPNQLLPVRPGGVVVESDLPIVRASTLAPLGAGITKGGTAELALDGDRASAWMTPLYDQPELSRTGAAGLVLDLGTKRQIRTINLGLVGNNTSLELLKGNKLSTNINQYKQFKEVVGAPAAISLREPVSVQARYIVILLTSVPVDGSGFRGGVSSVELSGR